MSSTNRKTWSQQEDQTIKNLVSINGIQDWTQISNKLKNDYPMSRRSGKQCRQRWYNHLSPIISKNPWSLEEEDKLFRLHRQQGNKWKDISKEFVGRTDNDLKNHFYSTLRKSLRRLNKSLGQKNSTSQMRQIKPSVLSKIMHHIYDEQNKTNLIDSFKDVPRLIFQFANIKPKKTELSLKDDQMRDKVLKIFCLINQFNDQYQKSKNSKRESVYRKLQKFQKSLISRPQDSTQNQSLAINNISASEQAGQNSIDSMFDEGNFQLKNQTIYDHTEIYIGYSTISSSFNQHIPCSSEEQNQDHLFMFIPHKNGIFDEDDLILQAEFQDPEEPSAINDYYFNETIFGRHVFQKIIEEETYCNRIVDEILDGHSQ